MRFCQPNTSDQHVCTQASLCCHTGINRVWGCVNHSKPQKTHPHTLVRTHTCQAAIPCSCVWRAKQWGANHRRGETEHWTIKNRLISWKNRNKMSLKVIFRPHTYTSYRQHHHWCSGLYAKSAGTSLDKEEMPNFPWSQLFRCDTSSAFHCFMYHCVFKFGDFLLLQTKQAHLRCLLGFWARFLSFYRLND